MSVMCPCSVEEDVFGTDEGDEEDEESDDESDSA